MPQASGIMGPIIREGYSTIALGMFAVTNRKELKSVERVI
jgi:hypothetical protein